MNRLNSSESQTTFIFIRHAESAKNLHHITGGFGDNLTEKGIKQAEKLAQFILNQHIAVNQINLISSEIIQAVQTTEILSRFLKLPYTIAKELKPAGMGVITGLSSDEIKNLYPDIALQLSAWRNRDIEAVDLSVYGMEPPDVFWKRILCYLKSLCNGKVNVIVSTRSIMVLVANLVSGATPERGGRYKHIPVRYCEMIGFKCSDYANNIVLCPSITTLSVRL